jgi:hypothetical protein
MSRLYNLDERTRAYIYRVLLAALPLLVMYGLLSEQEAAQYALLAAALLGIAADSLAAANTSTRPDDF